MLSEITQRNQQTKARKHLYIFHTEHTSPWTFMTMCQMNVTGKKQSNMPIPVDAKHHNQ